MPSDVPFSDLSVTMNGAGLPAQLSLLGLTPQAHTTNAFTNTTDALTLQQQQQQQFASLQQQQQQQQQLLNTLQQQQQLACQQQQQMGFNGLQNPACFQNVLQGGLSNGLQNAGLQFPPGLQSGFQNGLLNPQMMAQMPLLEMVTQANGALGLSGPGNQQLAGLTRLSPQLQLTTQQVTSPATAIPVQTMNLTQLQTNPTVLSSQSLQPPATTGLLNPQMMAHMPLLQMIPQANGALGLSAPGNQQLAGLSPQLQLTAQQVLSPATAIPVQTMNLTQLQTNPTVLNLQSLQPPAMTLATTQQLQPQMSNFFQQVPPPGIPPYMMPPPDNGTKPNGEANSAASSILEQFGSNGTKEPPFPLKLHQILSNPEHEECICWLPHGKSWRILKPSSFEQIVIPLYFRHAKYASFMRQVNGWGFKRVRT
jgi:hypothetical protein